MRFSEIIFKNIRQSKERIILGILCAITLLYLAPILNSNINLGSGDFLYNLSKYAFIRKSLFEFHQLPQWAPFWGGGFPYESDPTNPTFSIFIIPVLFFGEVLGAKVNMALICLGGVLGMFLLTHKIFKYNVPASLYAAIIFLFSGWIPYKLEDGNLDELYFYLFPALLFLFEKSKEHKIGLLGLLFLLTSLGIDGKLCFLSTLIFMGLYVVSNTFCLKGGTLLIDANPIKKYFLVIAMVFLLGAVKFIPMLDSGAVASQNLINRPRVYNQYNYDPHLTLLQVAKYFVKAEVPYKELNSNEKDLPLSLCFYMGYVPFIAALFGALFAFRRNGRWIFLWGISTLLFMLESSPINLFRYLWHFPFCQGLGQKYFSFFPLFAGCILAGAGVQLLANFKNPKKYFYYGVILILSVWPLLFYNGRIVQNLFRDKAAGTVSLKREDTDFFQVVGFPKDKHYTNHYFNLLNNIGTINWYAALFYNENAIPRFFLDRDKDQLCGNPVYQGELWFVKGGSTAAFEYFSPRRLKIKVNLSKPDVLVINQNFSRYWRVSRGKINDRGGLISVALSTPGIFTLELRYTNTLFHMAIILSLVLVLWLIIQYNLSKGPVSKSGWNFFCWLQDKDSFKFSFPHTVSVAIVFWGILAVGFLGPFLFQGIFKGEDLYRQAVEHLEVKNYDAALLSADKIIGLRQNWAEGYYLRAYIYYSKKMFRNAEKDLRRSLVIDSGIAESHYLLGDLCFETGRKEQADLQYKRAIAINPNLRYRKPDCARNLFLIFR